MIQEKELFLTQLRENLNDYEDRNLSREDQNFLIELFTQMIAKREKGEDEKKLFMFIQSQLKKRQNSKELQKAFSYLIDRAKGKYNIWGDIFILIGTLLNELDKYFTETNDVE